MPPEDVWSARSREFRLGLQKSDRTQPLEGRGVDGADWGVQKDHQCSAVQVHQAGAAAEDIVDEVKHR